MPVPADRTPKPDPTGSRPSSPLPTRYAEKNGSLAWLIPAIVLVLLVVGLVVGLMLYDGGTAVGPPPPSPAMRPP